MWIPDRIFDLFHISKDTLDAQREELASVRTERDGLKAQLAVCQANSDWMRIRVNSLEMERAQLIKKAYGLEIPVPEIVRPNRQPLELNPSLFEDLGDKMAKELGLPTYDN